MMTEGDDLFYTEDFRFLSPFVVSCKGRCLCDILNLLTVHDDHAVDEAIDTSIR